MAAAKLPKKERTQMDDKDKAPALIYLQWEGPEYGETNYEPAIHGDCTWCEDKINDDDILYRRASARTADIVARLTEENTRLREALRDVDRVLDEGRNKMVAHIVFAEDALAMQERIAALVKGEAKVEPSPEDLIRLQQERG